jgi:hypothetical protein
MLLRTLARRLRERDWVAVTIEVLIVVAGVFLGLQVSNWNELRKESARGAEYLLRLHDELLEDARGLQDIARFWSRVSEYGAIALAHAERGELAQGSAWKTLLAYYQASQVWPYRKPDITFQEIRSNGDLLLIRNAGLRARIARHYSAGAGSQVVEVLGLIPHYREDIRGLTPWAVQQYIWTSCYESNGVQQRLIDCPSPDSEAAARAVLERYRDSPQLTAGLRFWMVNVTNGLVIMKGVQVEAEALAQDIGAELER